MGRKPEEIIKGLECCRLAFGFQECGSRCPYYRDSCCGVLLAADAIALIQKLTAENAAMLETPQANGALRRRLRGLCAHG